MAVSSAAAGRGAKSPSSALQVEYASFEARIAAATVDLFVMLIIAALFVLVGSIVVLVSSDFERVDPSTTAINVFWICVGAIAPSLLLYFFVSYAWKGQTVGAAVMQLMIIRSDGRPLGVLGALARVIGILTYLLFILIGLIVALFFRDSTMVAAIAVGVAIFAAILGIIWAVFDRRRRTLHDRIAGTIVVRIR